ncbi:ephrin domain-containing protein [Phthorimaea operculella]|nr:ephrin domain-containing protein [Phthorimaea operculella]
MVSLAYFGLRSTPWTILVLIFFIESVMGNYAKSFYIHWNTTNSIFRIDNTDHVFDLNKGNAQFEYDQVNIICPVYAPGTFEEDTEKYIIYNVSKEEYDTCRITNPNPRIIAICDKPHKLMFFTITFRPFTPQPGGLEFLPGKDYYFISTSSKDDLHRRIGGRCLSHNMKLVFRVDQAGYFGYIDVLARAKSWQTTTPPNVPSCAAADHDQSEVLELLYPYIAKIFYSFMRYS